MDWQKKCGASWTDDLAVTLRCDRAAVDGGLCRKHRDEWCATHEDCDGTIYVTQGRWAGPFKVGFTSGNVADRLRTLQTGNPDVLEVVDQFPGTKRIERMIHEELSSHRLIGEWFDIRGYGRLERYVAQLLEMRSEVA